MFDHVRMFRGGGTIYGMVYECLAREEYKRGGDPIQLRCGEDRSESGERPSSARSYSFESSDPVQCDTLHIPENGLP